MTDDDLKEDVVRAFILAISLEPFADKPGCTTRYVDSSPGTKLEYFIVGATNSAWPLLSLVNRVLHERAQPDCVFDAAYLAQLASPRNRGGGKLNYAQILMLLPIILAQCLLHLEGRWPCEISELFLRVSQAMRATTRLDVGQLQKLVDLSTKLSEAHHGRLGTERRQLRPHFSGENILEAVKAEEFSHTMMATEISDGYPVCQRVYAALSSTNEGGLIRKSEAVYKDFLPELKRPDITADCLVVAFYLMLVLDKRAVHFP
ncbi:hypothetical protein [Ramlibacter sp. WS9]|uniref:hypothetical protein n=1 Tax=Ramlibacter sp. WS9 TaxID=1882741 RepID=UPI001141CD16|nr:hypothetical protein [Ramlibacter sp. WS9]ROZ63430.1 hypothetical protein EEB15_29930 [Ramlibacter sp. WS9]